MIICVLRVCLVNIEDEFQMDHLRRMALIKRHPQSKMYFPRKESMKKWSLCWNLSLYIFELHGYLKHVNAPLNLKYIWIDGSRVLQYWLVKVN